MVECPGIFITSRREESTMFQKFILKMLNTGPNIYAANHTYSVTNIEAGNVKKHYISSAQTLLSVNNNDSKKDFKACMLDTSSCQSGFFSCTQQKPSSVSLSRHKIHWKIFNSCTSSLEGPDKQSQKKCIQEQCPDHTLAPLQRKSQ